jgi:HSP90 family molecular chaperone
MSKHQFQTEVTQLLHLIIHSLYSHKEIFLRELISNASDALDKLKYLTLTDESYKKVDFDPRIDISFESGSAPTLTIADTGIGMNAEDLAQNLGTIASSGTRKFVEKLTGDAKKDSNLIGQFGVGFYSSFMVADRIEVISRKAGEEQAYRWSSDGKGEFEIEESSRDTHGATIILHLNDEGKEYSNRWDIQNIIKKYSNHIPFPIYLHYDETRHEGEGDTKKETTERKTEQINAASAIWKRSKSALKEEDYQEFYRSISHDMDDALLHIHTHAEGNLDYTTLFFIPQKAPMDLFRVDYTPGIKLYVKRVFITDDEKELMPTYLRFLRGVIDSEDMPLNLSREILQQSSYYVTGETEATLRNSPLLEMYRDKDIEVLIMDNEIDDIVISAIPKFKDYALKSVNRSDAANDLKTDDDRKKEESAGPVIEKIKQSLGDLVKDVRASVRLSDSPSCIVADENDPTVQMQHILKAMGQGNLPEFKPILEINPDHAVVKKLADMTDAGAVDDISFLLLEQAMLVEGVELKNPVAFVGRLNRVMERSL